VKSNKEIRQVLLDHDQTNRSGKCSLRDTVTTSLGAMVC
jgi:hypothetical protein